MSSPKIVVSLWHGTLNVPPERISMTQIIGEISEAYGVSVEALRGPGAFRRVSVPRQHAMWLMAKQKHLSLPMIGRFLGDRDHTTILHGIRAHQARLDAEKDAA